MAKRSGKNARPSGSPAVEAVRQARDLGDGGAPPAPAAHVGLDPDASVAPLAASVGVDAKLPGPAAATVPAAATDLPRSPGPRKCRAEVEVELIYGRLADVPSRVAVVGRFQGLPLQGTAAEIDDRLNNWIKRAFDFGIASARLGELTYVPLGRIRPRRIAPRNVLVAGMGDPGHFTRADLQYLYMNIVSAIYVSNLGGFSDSLANAPRYGLRLEPLLRSIFDGALDAFERFFCAEELGSGTSSLAPLRMTLVEPDPGQYGLLSESLRRIEDQSAGSPFERHCVSLRVRVTRREPPPPGLSLARDPGGGLDNSAPDTEPETPVVRFTITSLPGTGHPAHAGGAFAGSSGEHDDPGDSPPRNRRQHLTIQCTAVTNYATIPVREKAVDPYFVSQIPGRLVNASSLDEQEKFGLFVASYLLHEDFLRLLDADANAGEPGSLTLILDRSTAIFPWEMAAIRTNRGTRFFGSDFQLTRQFRTLFSDAPGVPPPLNSKLEVLVIADPADGRLALPGAEEEGLAVCRALCLAQQVWRNHFSLQLTLRLGAPGRRDRKALRDLIRAGVPGVSDEILNGAGPCDPFEIAALLTANQYDVVHFAGHGVFDPATEREGWVFNDDCTMSAKEIIQMRQVPRLVFANACLSGALETSEDPLPDVSVQQVSLAEAFFARGIENYIGAGWKVDDRLAVDFAVRFYLQALGVKIRPEGLFEADGLAPPATLGESIAAARRALLETIRNEAPGGPASTIWAAYQHYGQANSKLLPFTNADVERSRRGQS